MTKILLILFELGFIITFNIVGTISLSELFLIVSSVYYLPKINFRNKDISELTKLYLFLLVAQILSEFFVGNDLNNALKGLAITVVSFLHVMFLYSYLKKDCRLVIYCIIGIIMRLILAGDLLGDESVGSVGDSKFVFLLKFYGVPIVYNTLLILTIIKSKWRVEVIFISLGLLFIGLGARSGGMILFLAGAIYYLIISKKSLGIKSYTPIIVAGFFVLMGGYFFYVNKVLSGEITSGNSEQLLRLENPYNPVNLLMTGRTEAFVGAVAFMDNPLTGWGAWAEDPDWKYHILGQTIGSKGEIKNFDMVNVIPSHSVLIGSGMQNGIFALLAMLSIFIFTIRRAVYSIKAMDIYSLFLVGYLLDFCWISMFSPLSHFRLTLPLIMVFILVRFQINRYKERVVISQKTAIND